MQISWKDVAHYGSGVACLAMAGLTEIGVQLPGVTVDPKIAGAAGIGILAAGLKSGVTSGKAVIAFLIGSLALLSVSFGGPAHAADLKLPVKAAPIPFVNATPCTLQSCSGFYVGGDLLESGGNFDVIGTGLSGLAQNNLAMGGHAGYEFWNGKWFAAFEGGADYGVVQNGALPGGGNHGLWDVYGLGKLGYDFSGIFGAGTNGTATPTLPQSIANALMSPYVILGVWDRPWGAGLASGAGVQALLATNWTLSVDYIHVNYNNANVNAIVSEQTENLVRASVDYHF